MNEKSLIDDLDLSVRSYNCLRRRGINTIGDLKDIKSIDELMRIRTLGRRCMEDIVAKVRECVDENWLKEGENDL